MSVYLQFDSKSRSDAYIEKDLGMGNVWVPNDNIPNTATPPFNLYQYNHKSIQTPTNYRVFYSELNNTNNKRTICFPAHCKEKWDNLTYQVDLCAVTLPANALIKKEVKNDIGEITNTEYIDILDEPYLYVKMTPINFKSNDLITGNNTPAIDSATFVIWQDKTQFGTQNTPLTNPLPRPNPVNETDLSFRRWIIYKSCMKTTMRLNLDANEWHIRIYDRYNNDVVIGEPDNMGSGYDYIPDVDRSLQTSIVVGITPNYCI